MTTPIKSDRLELYRLAKKAQGLSRTEKQTLLAIADACSMRDAVCRKSAATIDKERGLAPRSLYDGVHGRTRPDGTEYFPGLLKRGLVFIKAGGSVKAGVPTIYGINIVALQSFAEGGETSAQTSAQNDTDLGTNGGGTSALMPSHLGTNADKVHPKVRRREEEEVPPANCRSHSGSPFGGPNGDGQEKQMLEDVTSIQAFCVDLTGKIPKRKDVESLLRSATQSEIQCAFRDYVKGLDEKNVPWAEKSFFADGGGVAVILKIRQSEWKSMFDHMAEHPEQYYEDFDEFLADHPAPAGIYPSDVKQRIDAARKARAKWDAQQPAAEATS